MNSSYAFALNELSFTVLDITDPSKPRHVSQQNFLTVAYKLELVGNQMFVANGAAQSKSPIESKNPTSTKVPSSRRNGI